MGRTLKLVDKLTANRALDVFSCPPGSFPPVLLAGLARLAGFPALFSPVSELTEDDQGHGLRLCLCQHLLHGLSSCERIAQLGAKRSSDWCLGACYFFQVDRPTSCQKVVRQVSGGRYFGNAGTGGGYGLLV